MINTQFLSIPNQIQVDCFALGSVKYHERGNGIALKISQETADLIEKIEERIAESNEIDLSSMASRTVSQSNTTRYINGYLGKGVSRILPGVLEQFSLIIYGAEIFEKSDQDKTIYRFRLKFRVVHIPMVSGETFVA